MIARVRSVLVVSALALAAPTHADDDPARLVVAPFTGSAKLAAKAREVVIAHLVDRYELIPGRQYKEALEEQTEKVPPTEQIARVAAVLSADAVVVGKIEKRRGRYRVRIAVHLGLSGDELVVRRVGLRRRALRPRDRRNLARQTKAIMKVFDARWAEVLAEDRALDESSVGSDTADSAAAGSAAAAASAADPDASDGSGADGAADKNRTIDPFGGSGVTAGSEVAAVDDELSGDEPVQVDAAAPRSTPRFRGAREGGGSFIGRELSFELSDGLSPGVAPTEFENRGASGVYVKAALHPLAWLGEIPGDLGITIAYERTIGLKTDFNGEKLGTLMQQLGFGLQVLHVFGRDGPAVKLAVGLNRLGYAIDDGGMDIGLPDVLYQYIDFGLGARVPVVGPLAVYGEGRYMQVLDSGEFGEDAAYGGNDTSGIDAEGGIDVALVDKLALRAGVRYTRIDAAFDGTGALTELDGDGEQDVVGSTDSFLGGYLTAAYTF